MTHWYHHCNIRWMCHALKDMVCNFSVFLSYCQQTSCAQPNQQWTHTAYKYYVCFQSLAYYIPLCWSPRMIKNTSVRHTVAQADMFTVVLFINGFMLYTELLSGDWNVSAVISLWIHFTCTSSQGETKTNSSYSNMSYYLVNMVKLVLCFFFLFSFFRQTKGTSFPIESRGCWAIMKMWIIPVL